jgi:hypothetical protein
LQPFELRWYNPTTYKAELAANKITGPTIPLLMKSVANQTNINKLLGKIPNKKATN